jgi:pimeloyl-ACP methyl ester carboxylesterase
MHGWHGQVKASHPDNVAPPRCREWFLIEPEMRGRGDSTGKQDANGWELHDVVDAVEFAKAHFADSIADPDAIHLIGGSGGGGNTLGLVGKFPDYFCTAVCECGISDYALWFEEDAVGEFRDELETAGWIGGSPATEPEAYASRGGLTTLDNLLTPLALVHGDLDARCRVNQARRYVETAQRRGKGALIDYLELRSVGGLGHYDGMTPEQNRQREEFINRHLATHRRPIRIPTRGAFVVAGYLKTKEFQVILPSINRIARLEYDLEAPRFVLSAEWEGPATLRFRGKTQSLAVRKPWGGGASSHDKDPR